MNVDELVRDALREQADEQTPLDGGFADRVLAVRRRRRTRGIVAVAAATAAVVAVAVAVPLLDSGKDEVRFATETNRSDIIAHPDQSPPRDMIAAGDKALAAYYTWDTVLTSKKDTAVLERTYRMLDQKTGKYETDSRWSVVSIAPGMRTAAVLEKDLPAKRIGLLDLRTGEVERWIGADRGVAGVEFSPDGTKLVATTYSENPDLLTKVDYDADGDGKKNDYERNWFQSPRTGFYIVDVDSGEADWSEVVFDNKDGDLNVRQDFAFSDDGKLVYSGLTTEPHEQFYDLEGNEVPKPANEKYLHWIVGARLSPNGKLAAGDFAGDDKTTASWILDAHTGEKLHKVRGQELLTWIDDKRLIAWDIAPGDNEFHNALVLVTIGSDKTIKLSGARKRITSREWGDWVPLFATR
ncbi:WD40 repeat domain-containing protein [Streptomyces sp. NPDC002643]